VKSKLSPEEPGFRRMLVAVDGSENSKRAARIAVELAEKFGAQLDVLHVVPRLVFESTPVSLTRVPVPATGYGRLYAEARKEAEKYVGDVVSEARARGVLAKGDVLEDKPSIVETIIEYSKNEKVDLIVTGTRGQGGFKKLLIGSVSSGVVAHAECPVLVVR
jgi:nucleotide-binding universal stress UspA family protein